jgi:ABC-2 type transport system ATP-binding protein
MTEAIAVSGLRKSYGKAVALDGLDLSVAEGEVHGFLGPNGAGKTTAIRILLGLLRADGGSARLLGGDPWHDATALHRRLAYVPGDVTLWPNFTGGEVIDLLGRLRGGLDAKRRASLLERFDLDPTKKARAYSKGNRQKVALISALASDVELLILDEPTSGLDPLMEAAFRECIEEERHGGRTVLLSSHILSEVEALCDRVTIIRAGRVVESGTLAGLRHLTRTSVAADLGRRPAGLDQLPGVHDLDVRDLSGPQAPEAGGVAASRPTARVRCEVDTDKLDAVVRSLADAGILSLVSQPPTLEELFLRHYAGPGAGVAAPGGSGGSGGAGDGARRKVRA